MPSPVRSAIVARPLRRSVMFIVLALSLVLPSASAADAPADSAALFRLDARARAAATLAAAGSVADANVQLDRAGSEALTALAAGSQRDASAALLSDLRRAVASGDRAAATAAVRRLDAMAMAALPKGPPSSGAQALLTTLVRDAGREGQEGASGGGTEPAAYAAALADITVDIARRLSLSATVVGAVQTLSESLRGTPSKAVVASTTDTALAALGAAPDTADTARAFDAIAADLELAQKRLAGGDRAGANEALIDAYLEHFEDLEPPLERLAPALKDSLEHALRDELRAMVRQGASADAFAKALDAVRADLARAQAVLP